MKVVYARYEWTTVGTKELCMLIHLIKIKLSYLSSIISFIVLI